MYKQCPILRKRTGSYVLPDTPPDQHFQLLFLHQENEEILLPPVRAVRLRYRHRRIVEAIPPLLFKRNSSKSVPLSNGDMVCNSAIKEETVFSQACVKCCAICFGNEPRNDGICQNTANTGQQKSDCKYFCK